MPRIGRNHPCSCGSGRKYKNCCLPRSNDAKAERERDQTLLVKPTAWLPPGFAEEILHGFPQELHGRLDATISSLTHFHQLFGDAAKLSVTAGLGERAKDIEHQVKSAATTAFFLHGVRMTVLLTDFVEALGRRRLVSAALTARAAIETAAASVYLDHKVAGATEQADEARLPTVLAELRKALFGGRFPWAHVVDGDEGQFELALAAFATGKQTELPKDVEAVNVLTMMKQLDRRCAERFGDAGVAQMVYEQLSDFCHPAVGTAIAFLRSADQPGGTRVVLESGNRATGLFWSMMGAFVAPICETGVLALSSLLTKATELGGAGGGGNRASGGA